jgi:hypothetical protein
MSSTSYAKNKKKRRKMELEWLMEDEDEDELDMNMSFMSSFTLVLLLILHHTLASLGFRGNNLHRTRKDIEEDIFLPLGDTFFRRAYRMDKATFYYLHDLLQDDLEKHFFPKGGGTRDIRTNAYLIKTEIRLSLAIRFFFGCFSI